MPKPNRQPNAFSKLHRRASPPSTRKAQHTCRWEYLRTDYQDGLRIYKCYGCGQTKAVDDDT